MMKFLKTIRFDPSDLQVFETAAEQDEWAIPGGFLYSQMQESELKGKRKQAFSNGFLSIESLGISTFVSVAEIDEDKVGELSQMLAAQFIEKLGAPNFEEALNIAKQEVQFIVDMCAEVPINSIFAVGRYFENDEIHEEFSIVKAPGEALHARVWEVVGE